MSLDATLWGARLVHWLGAGMLNGSAFTLLTWLVSATLLRRASARVTTCVWTLSLLSFVLTRPLQLRALPLSAARSYADALSAGPAAWVWQLYLGMISLLCARTALRQQRLRKSIAGLAKAPDHVQACVREVARCLSLAHVPEVRVTPQDVLPFTLGPFRPTLVLPAYLCIAGPRLRAVLLHELSHLARRDHWLLTFERMVTSAFFFWPPVLWAARKLEQARELACDEHALTRSALPAHDYGQHLVDVIACARAQRTGGHALAIGRRGPWLERRIDSLLSQAWARPMHVREAIALVLLLSASLIGLGVPPLRTPGTRAALPSSDSTAVACDGSAMSHAP